MTTKGDRCHGTERISEYALRALPTTEIPSVEAHVADCPECRRELETLRPIVEAFVDWPADVLRTSTSLWDRLSERIAAETGRKPPPTTAQRWADEPDWKEVAPGISCKLLATDEENARVSMIVRLAPGVDYPPHSHAGVEELHLLDGELWIDDRKLCPGDYNRAEPGTADSRIWSETGCTCVLITSFRDVLR